jgi:hypothetical protein
METVTCIAQRAASMRLINFTRQPFNSVCWLGQIHVQQICKYRMKLTFISGLMNEKRNECTPFINRSSHYWRLACKLMKMRCRSLGQINATIDDSDRSACLVNHGHPLDWNQLVGRDCLAAADITTRREYKSAFDHEPMPD